VRGRSGGIDGAALGKPNMQKCLDLQDLILYQKSPTAMHYRQPTPKSTTPTLLFVVKWNVPSLPPSCRLAHIAGPMRL
jgi:hypothetical protein